MKPTKPTLLVLYKTREPGWCHALLMITMYDEEENEKKHSISISSWTQKKLMKQKLEIPNNKHLNPLFSARES